jgi:outer membrane protein OmpA-like peptidoglycan-associated protein
VSQHQVAAARLTAHGVGPLAPAASNRTDEGKARNRRVEIIEQ